MIAAAPGFGRRLACMLYEGLVVFAVLLIGFWLPQALLSGIGLAFSPRLLWLHLLLLLLFYFVWFWLHGGQTLPMKTWKMRVVNQDGSPLRPLQAVLRYLAAWPSILLFGIGILWALVDRDRQFLHDRIAGSRIVSETS
ncbi:MAG: RDD family protein [Betaproteobacteria bacterium HGW-Betaproteobacteria-7]|jgi:uncharacterized RDD family membrane protein YckC|nr:MAG: RDD family protein [Betaproteobacteria bacterium HGW-Betaproteobacteria-7]